MKARYWENIGGVLYKKEINITDGLKDSLEIEIDCGDFKRKLLVSREGIKYKTVRQETILHDEDVAVSFTTTFKKLEEENE
jgi:hypothetical protein